MWPFFFILFSGEPWTREIKTLIETVQAYELLEKKGNNQISESVKLLIDNSTPKTIKVILKKYAKYKKANIYELSKDQLLVCDDEDIFIVINN